MDPEQHRLEKKPRLVDEMQDLKEEKQRLLQKEQSLEEEKRLLQNKEQSLKTQIRDAPGKEELVRELEHIQERTLAISQQLPPVLQMQASLTQCLHKGAAANNLHAPLEQQQQLRPMHSPSSSRSSSPSSSSSSSGGGGGCSPELIRAPKQPNALTENAAPAFASTGNQILDLFFSLAETNPQFDTARLGNKVLAAARVAPQDTLRVIFHARDCRKGKGIRAQAMHSLATFMLDCLQRQHVLQLLVGMLPDYGRYRDLFDLVRLVQERDPGDLNPSFHEAVLCAYLGQLKADLAKLQADASASISLAAKWLTSENKRGLAQINSELARRAFPGSPVACARFRKELLAPLRSRLQLVESRMFARDFHGINYEAVPSKAVAKYAKAFKRNDGERHGQYMEALREGRATIKGGRLYPHDIVHKLLKLSPENPQEAAEVEQLEHQWNAMVKDNVHGEALKDVLVLSDVSGSMEGTPMEVSIALGILISGFASSPFTNNVITFSEKPTFHELPNASLWEKVGSLKSADWGGNTDLMKVFKLILSKLGSGEFATAPKTLIILSDMQFDAAVGGGRSGATNFEAARAMFKARGLDMPGVVFWNLRLSEKDAFPVSIDDRGVTMLSGPSPVLMDSLLQARELTPMMILREMVLEKPRYACITYPGAF